MTTQLTGYTTREVREGLSELLDRATPKQLDELCRVFADPRDPYLQTPSRAKEILQSIMLATPSSEQLQEAARILISPMLYQDEDGYWQFAGEESVGEENE